MNKADLVSNIAKKSGMARKDVEVILSSFLGEVTEVLSTGGKVQLVGFGTFETRQRGSRVGRNPQTGKEIQIPATNVPAFKAGNKLKEAVK